MSARKVIMNSWNAEYYFLVASLVEYNENTFLYNSHQVLILYLGYFIPTSFSSIRWPLYIFFYLNIKQFIIYFLNKSCCFLLLWTSLQWGFVGMLSTSLHSWYVAKPSCFIFLFTLLYSSLPYRFNWIKSKLI